MRTWLFALAALCALCRCCDGAKILVFVPALSKSNLIFYNNVADTLADAGHDVTLYLAQIVDESHLNRTQFVRKAKPYLVPGDDGAKWTEMEEHLFRVIFTDFGFMDKDANKNFNQMVGLFMAACEVQVRNTAALDELRAERFDIAMGHHYDLCWLGLAEMLGIRSVVWATSAGAVPLMTATAGVPLTTSFVPGFLTGYGDQMTFYERTMNFVGNVLMTQMISKFYAPMTEVFRKNVRADFPDLVDLGTDRTQLYVLNGIEMLEFPQPYFSNFIHIGGIGIGQGRPLDKRWSQVYASAKSGVVVISFGSVTSADSMPESWKATIIAAAAALPDYTFIWKYDSRDIYDKFDVPANVIISKWLPQRDLLGDSRTSVFVTHGGQNSALDAALAGTPVIVVPLFGDQFHNAAVLCKRHRMGLTIGKKADMAERPEVFVEAVTELVRNNSYYMANARRLSSLLHRRPENGELLLVQWVDYVLEFGELDVLKSASRHMGIMQIMSYDVIAFLLAVLHLMVFSVVMVVKMCCFSKARSGGSKKKKE